ncbi:MAG: ABC transporter ATP-binding protein [Corynebacterium sp.]|nr:ABC transporter ATP-binding protein [Corynebacterium sp.]
MNQVAMPPMPAIPGPAMRPSKLPTATDRRWLVRTVFSQRPWSFIGSLGMAVSFICNGMLPVAIGYAIDRGVAQGEMQSVLRWGIAILALGVVGMAAQYTGMFFALRSEQFIAHDLRMVLSERIQDPRGFKDARYSPGDLLSIASTDVNRVSRCVIMTIFPVAEISSVLYVTVMLFFIHPILGLALLIAVPLLVLLAGKLSQPLRKRSLVRQQRLGATAAKATDYLQGLRVIKGLAAVLPAQRNYKQQSDAAYTATIGAAAAQATLFAVTQIAGLVFVVGITVVAGLLAIDGDISIGQCIAAIGLAQFIVTPVTMLGRNIATVWASGSASAQRIRELLNTDYSRSETLGEPTATALQSSLPKGLVVVPAEELASMRDLAFLVADNVRIAPHTAQLFSGTVGENISLDATEARVALELAHGADIPGGIAREVGEAGMNLSGGQRQRVALARALASKADVLMLQDPITAVDSLTAAVIVDAVYTHRRGQTTVVISPAPVWRNKADAQLSPAAFNELVNQAIKAGA